MTLLLVGEAGRTMKDILLVSASWLVVSFLISLLVGKLITGRRPRHPSRSGGVLPASGGEPQRSLTDRRADLQTCREKSLSLREDDVALHVLTEKHAAHRKELETRMAQIKDKLEVVPEASRMGGFQMNSDRLRGERVRQED